MQTEKIGKVTLDYTHYNGEDLYSDGPIEDELLQIVENHNPGEFAKIIEQSGRWEIFYHLSELRGNIVEWIPMEANARVLEVGAGCGAITGTLSRKAAQVTCVDLSKKRSLINANRNRDSENITIHVGNFRDIEPGLPTGYNYIFLIGVFEYGLDYIGTDHPYENFIRLLQKHLAPGGRIIIAIENRLGLKYFAGCREDHNAGYFSGIEGYQGKEALRTGARTFSRAQLNRILRSCGLSDIHFYYPYPDYKFMTMLHSDLYLPRHGELIDNVRNFDRDRLVLFNEKRAFDALIDDRMYADFANSFEVVIGPAFPTIYTKYSNDRAPEFQIRTDIAVDRLGRLQIRKYPLTMAAREHIRAIRDAYTTLTDRYRGGDLSVNDCTVDDKTGVAVFSYVNGIQLSTLMDRCVAAGDKNGFDKLFREYLRRVSYREDYPAADFDLIFSNIIVNGSIWTIIDYEWTYGKRIATRDVAFRALYNYVLEDHKRAVIDVDHYYEYLGLSQADTARLLEEEAGFQKYVTGDRKSVVEIWKDLGYRQIVPRELAEEEGDAQRADRIQIYNDFGEGYSEAKSYFPNIVYDAKGCVTLNIHIEEGIRAVRLDPAFTSCIVTLKRVAWNGAAITEEDTPVRIHPNGAWLSDDSIVFDTGDPNIEFNLDPSIPKGTHENVLSVTMIMSMISQEVAENLVRYQMDAPADAEEEGKEPGEEEAAEGAPEDGYELMEIEDVTEDADEAEDDDDDDDDEYVEDDEDDEDDELYDEEHFGNVQTRKRGLFSRFTRKRR